MFPCVDSYHQHPYHTHTVFPPGWRWQQTQKTAESSQVKQPTEASINIAWWVIREVMQVKCRLLVLIQNQSVYMQYIPMPMDRPNTVLFNQTVNRMILRCIQPYIHSIVTGLTAFQTHSILNPHTHVKGIKHIKHMTSTHQRACGKEPSA